MPAPAMFNRAGPRGGEVPPKEAKKSKTLTAVKPVEKEEGVKIIQPVCMICHNPCLGYYGRWGDSGVCSSKCEDVAKEREAEKQQDQAEA